MKTDSETEVRAVVLKIITNALFQIESILSSKHLYLSMT